MKKAPHEFAAKYQKQLAALENKLVNLRRSVASAHVESAKGWLKELAGEANKLRREIEQET